MSQLSIDLLFEYNNKPTRFELNALKEPLKHCPFCGSVEVHFLENKEGAFIEVWVRCSHCGADAPPRFDRLMALEMWNKRYYQNNLDKR